MRLSSSGAVVVSKGSGRLVRMMAPVVAVVCADVTAEGKGCLQQWDTLLNELNYLVLKISSVNALQGLHFTRAQAESLHVHSRAVDSLPLTPPRTETDCYPEIMPIVRTFRLLLRTLESGSRVSDSLRQQVTWMRMRESGIIKKSVLASRAEGYSAGGCPACHGPPDRFPRGDASRRNTETIGPERRRIIDSAHVAGVFGEEGIRLLWNRAPAVRGVLTEGQTHILKDFRCCLIPPPDLAAPANIGQVVLTSQWVGFLREVRALPDDQWRDFKQLFYIPIEDLLAATLPGISSREKRKIIRRIDRLASRTRKLDEVDFQLRKEELCRELKQELSVDYLIGETTRTTDERAFMAAMFLLFPGSSSYYEGAREQPGQSPGDRQ